MKQHHVRIEADTEISCGNVSPGLLLVFRNQGEQVCVWGDVARLEEIQRVIQEQLSAPPPWGMNPVA